MGISVHQLSGVFYFDWRPVSPMDRSQASGDVVKWRHDTLETYCAPGLLMTCADPSLAVPERYERGLTLSPLRNACAWDGRLDNRSELIARLGREDLRRATDSTLVLAVYEAGYPSAFHPLIGDWSLAIWDAVARTVVLASDYAGTRPLYYCREVDRLLWSSSLEHLAAWATAREIDEEYVAEFLTRGLVAHRTPYRGIYSVPPGCLVRVTQDQLLCSRFWNFPVEQVACHRRGDEYEEQLRTLFRDAVAARIDTAAPACAELSGGLDSSSVVCMADALISSYSVQAPKLVTFTYRHESSTDERFFGAVEQACTLSSIHLKIDDYPLVDPTSVGKSAPMWWQSRLTEVSRRMAAIGSTVFLTGQLGDLIMGNWLDDSEQTADYLQQGRFSHAVREAFAWSRSLQLPVYSVLWRALKATLSSKPAGGNSDFLAPGSARHHYGHSLAPAFLKRADLLDRQRLRAAKWRNASPTLRKRVWALSELLDARKLQCPEPLQHVSYAHPFTHRPLVEFMLTLPAAVVCRPGEPRRLMRRAFAGMLPNPVLHRRSKGTYDTVFFGSFRPLASRLLQDISKMRLIEYGYVDRYSVETRLQRLSQSLDCNEPQLRNLILLELWLRAHCPQPASRRSAVRVHPHTPASATTFV